MIPSDQSGYEGKNRMSGARRAGREWI